MRAVVLSQVPDTHTAAPITANDLALVGVNHHVVDRTAVRVAPLDRTAARLPDLHCAIFRAGDHPFALAVEGYACDVARVTLEAE